MAVFILPFLILKTIKKGINTKYVLVLFLFTFIISFKLFDLLFFIPRFGVYFILNPEYFNIWGLPLVLISIISIYFISNNYKNLDLLGLKDQALKKSNKLSGGQQQRVAIARAMINNPTIIMGDEPTGNLDSKNAQIVFDIFKELSIERGQTIIAVTHDDDFAKNCDNIIELYDGSILQ
jgi:ABC-type oligopeptide transport system ATPase subunit